MTMYRDDKSVPSGIYDDPNNRVIYSHNMAADFKWTRIYDFLILDSSIAKNNTMHYVVIFNIRTNQIEAEFKDVEFSTKFEYLSDHFEMKIGNDTYFINGSKLVKG